MNNFIFKLKLKYFFMKHSVVIIESDDWGYASMYNKDKFESVKSFIKDFNSPYAYHCIENKEDLEKLFELCSMLKDDYDNNLVFTANFIVQQPDFNKIIENNFEKLFFKNIDVKKYKQLIKNKVFFPQFHGRHHFNIKNWEYDLKNDLNNSRLLCENEVFVLIPYNIQRYNGENAEVTKNEIKFHNEEYLRYLIEYGLKIFKKLFGFNSKSVIAPSYYKNEICEKIYFENGVKYIQGDDFSHLHKKESKLINKKTYLGNKSNGLISLCRNIIFEPSRWFFNKNDLIHQKNILFLKTKEEIYKGNPLVICSHSYNYLGSLNSSMRDFSLNQLKDYIIYINKINHKTIFLNSVQLGELLETGKIEELKLNIADDIKLNYFEMLLNLIKSKYLKLKILFFKVIKRINK